MLVRGVPAREKNPNKSRKSKNSENWCMHAGALPVLDKSISETVVCFWDVFEVEARVICRARRSSTWRAARALVRCHPSTDTTRSTVENSPVTSGSCNSLVPRTLTVFMQFYLYSTWEHTQNRFLKVGTNSLSNAEMQSDKTQMIPPVRDCHSK